MTLESPWTANQLYKKIQIKIKIAKLLNFKLNPELKAQYTSIELNLGNLFPYFFNAKLTRK